MNQERTPYDGKPYYCNVCGLGLGEYAACEEPDCELESVAEAEARRDASPLPGQERDAPARSQEEGR